jgi:hypothetical protein
MYVIDNTTGMCQIKIPISTYKRPTKQQNFEKNTANKLGGKVLSDGRSTEISQFE